MKYEYFGNEVKDIHPLNNLYRGIKTPQQLYKALSHIWSIETCAPRLRKDWSKENMTLGQCSITSFLVQDIFGGEVYGVKLPDGGVHCFNVVDGKKFDLTSEQFGEEKLIYELDLPQTREEHFKDENKKARYELLKAGLENYTKKQAKTKKIITISALSVGGVVATLITFVIGYVGYVLLSYYRIGNKPLDVNHHSTLTEVKVGETYKATSYNIGFGAYSQDYTFFLDTGYDREGKETCGYWSTARSKDEVLFNTNGAIELAKSTNSDFIFFQEVDTDSTRSYHVNQYNKIVDKFASYDNVFCKNFHSAFLPYPLYDMHGSVNAGLTTVSKYQIQSAERKQYTISSSLSKLFDLDRCFSVSEVNVENNKKLYIVNSHMSAYDKGGEIRTKQVAELNAFLQEKKDAGDYVLVGGDWNHDLLTYNPDFSYTSTNIPFDVNKKIPDWLSYYFDENGQSPLIDGYRVVASDNTPTCRNNDIGYEPGESFTCVVDGFIVSDNIQVISHQNLKSPKGKKGIEGFAYSDHDPATLEFKLL